MFRRSICSSLLPSAAAHMPPAATPFAYALSQRQRVNAAAMAGIAPARCESQRFHSNGWWMVDDLLAGNDGEDCFRNSSSKKDGWWMVADLLPKNERESLEESLRLNLRLIKNLQNQPSYPHWRSSDLRLREFLDSGISQLLAIAKNPLVTQADLGEMRKAGVLAVLHEKYIIPRDCASHLVAKAEELARILSTPPEASDPYHYLNQLADSVEEGDDPSSALKTAKDVVLSSRDVATRQAAARLHGIALRELINHYDFLIDELWRGNEACIPLAQRALKNAPNSNDHVFQEVLAELKEALRETQGQ